VAEGFATRWDFQHCLGAIDGKHVAIRCPRKGGSLYHNYKGFHSIVLMAVVDSKYRFIWVNIGAYGSCSDAQIFNDSELAQMIADSDLGFPPPDALLHDNHMMAYFLVGDDAFALRTWMMKPFSYRRMTDEERIFNYRLSRARRVVENAFGILANRFRCLLKTLPQEPRVVQKITMAAVCLHNLMRDRFPGEQNRLLDQEDDLHNIVPGAWREDQPMHDIAEPMVGNREGVLAKRQRLLLKHYYNNPVGAVYWQRDQL
jgi:hypothetical protein